MKNLSTFLLIAGLVALSGCSATKTWPRDQAVQLYSGDRIEAPGEAAYIYRTASTETIRAMVTEIDGKRVKAGDGEVFEIQPGLHRILVRCSTLKPRRASSDFAITPDLPAGAVFTLEPRQGKCPNAGYTLGEKDD